MKKIILFLFAAVLIFTTGCKDTNEPPVHQRDEGTITTISNLSPAFFTMDLESSYIAFDVDVPEGTKLDRAYIEVSYKGEKSILRDVEIPSNIVVTAYEILQLLGIDASEVQLGDVFDIAVVTVVNGVTTRSMAAVRANVTCELDNSLTVGAYKFESSDWEEAGDVTLIADEDDPNIIYVDGYAGSIALTPNGNKITMVINPNTFAITGPKVAVCDEAWGYHNLSYEAKGGTYNSCDGTYTVTFGISVDEGSFGSYGFTFRRSE